MVVTLLNPFKSHHCLCLYPILILFNIPSLQLGGICLLGVGIWIVIDPDGFQNIFTSNPLLSAGGYILLFVGLALSLLGFLGCFGAIRQSKPLLLLVSLMVSGKYLEIVQSTTTEEF